MSTNVSARDTGCYLTNSTVFLHTISLNAIFQRAAAFITSPGCNDGVKHQVSLQTLQFIVHISKPGRLQGLVNILLLAAVMNSDLRFNQFYCYRRLLCSCKHGCCLYYTCCAVEQAMTHQPNIVLSLWVLLSLSFALQFLQSMRK